MRFAGRAVCLLACISVVAAPAEASKGSLGVQLLDVPTSARLDPRARLYIVDHVTPGTVIRRRIQISNSTPSAADIAIYPAAATIAKGTFVGAAGHTKNELSIWTAVRPDAPRIRAGGRQSVVVKIAVPSDAAPGERYGVVWAETRSAPATGDGITQVNRVGIRLYVSVGPGGPPAANFKIDSVTAKRTRDGHPMVLATVHNTGGRALDMSGTLRLRDGPGGLNAGPYPADLGVSLAIGDTETVRIVLDDRLPAGPWDAQINLRSGLLSRTAAATITFPGDQTSSSWPRLVIIGLLGLIGLLLLITALLARRRQRAPAVTRNGRGLRPRARRA